MTQFILLVAFCATSTFRKSGVLPFFATLISFVTCVWIRTSKFGLLMTGWRYAVAELLRSPLPEVDWVQPLLLNQKLEIENKTH